MSESPVKVGIIGCGAISSAYLNGCPFFENLSIVAVADLDRSRAEARAKEYHIPLACDVPTLLSHPEIEIVINLTIPKAHGEIALAALAAGKSVYNEKPLALTREEGRQMLADAAAKSLRVGCAPDTFLGAGYQTCRKLIDDGAIGEPIGATAFMTCHGHESWHPDPDFYYQPGGGPMLDMGPYYLTALAFLLGPVRRVTGSTRITFPERTITSKPKYGQTIHVNVPTHVTGIMDYETGAIGTILTSFDVWAAQLPRIEVYGTEGSLNCPDPNGFGGPVKLWKNGEWKEAELTHSYTSPGRSIGVADMAYAMRSGRPHRVNGQLAYHVLDLMYAFDDASKSGRHIDIESACDRPAPLATGDIHEALRQG